MRRQEREEDIARRCIKDRNDLDVRKYSFTQRVVAVWNSLTENVASAPNVNTFKNRLDKIWENELIRFHYRENLTGIRFTRRR